MAAMSITALVYKPSRHLGIPQNPNLDSKIYRRCLSKQRKNPHDGYTALAMSGLVQNFEKAAC